jgi:diaminohydroxyphosphoribosylaminopyrimidine deaminase / 5-amino-6-(5-phosphoribosylamino)uracil reductase
MAEALTLAHRGTGHVSPNPRVGCVIVKGEQVIGRGWHKAYGTEHAEVNALNDCVDDAEGATAYVTLEPCAHHGQTPPCVNALIDAKVAHVVIAVQDDNPKAKGGAQLLEEAGIKVTLGVRGAEARFQNRAFFHHLKTKRPWVIGKTATSLDGRIATRTGHSQWITGPAARRRSHDLRQAVDAIVVGAETLRNDNPTLTVRDRWDEVLASLQPSHPLRIIVSSTGILPTDFHALDGSLPGKSLVATTDQMPASQEEKLVKNGTEVLRLPSNSVGQINISAFLDALAPRCQSIVVEGGAQLLGAFVDARMIDEVWSFIAPKWIGGASAPASVGGLGVERLEQSLTLHDVRYESLEPDLLIRGLVDRSPNNDL